MDESGVNCAMTRLYARSPKGQRAFGHAPRNWGENVSIIGSLSLHGPLASVYLAGATDGAAFLAYVEQMLAPELWPGAVVVMDNLRAHKVKGVRARPSKPPGRACFTCHPTRRTSTLSNWPGANSRATCATPLPGPAKSWVWPSARPWRRSLRRTPITTSPLVVMA